MDPIHARADRVAVVTMPLARALANDSPLVERSWRLGLEEAIKLQGRTVKVPGQTVSLTPASEVYMVVVVAAGGCYCVAVPLGLGES